MSAEQSKQMYQQLIDKLKQEYKQERIFDGRFGDYMTVNIGSFLFHFITIQICFVLFRK